MLAQQLIDASEQGGLAFTAFAVMVFLFTASLFYMDRVRRKRATSLVLHNRDVRPVRGSRLVAITFDSPNAALSARVANGFATAFIETNLERRYDSASYARNFLEDRLKQLKYYPVLNLGVTIGF